MVWPRFKVFWFSKYSPTGHSERTKKKKQTEEEVGRQNQRVDRSLPAQLGQLKTRQDGEGCCELICGAPTSFQGYGNRKVSFTLRCVALLWSVLQ